jgi:RNA polymerase sigma-70 factor (ECF subfamily)
MSAQEQVQAPDAAREFEAHRRFLWGLCYRMTGSAADADDLVQETFVRALQRRPSGGPSGWRPWLAKVAANLSIDALRRRKRRDYVGPWLPAPIETGDEASPPAHEIASNDESTEHRYDLMESVSMAFLLALERLSPRQRAVLLLRDVFDYTVRETSAALDLSEANVKVTHHRARLVMHDYEGARARPTRVRQSATGEKLREFLQHLQNQDVAAVEAMLAADARLLSDGGGEFAAAMNPIIGREKCARLFLAIAAKNPPDTTFAIRMLNGLPAVLVERSAPAGHAPRFSLQIDLGPDGRIREVHTVLATSKLSAVRFTPPSTSPTARSRV